MVSKIFMEVLDSNKQWLKTPEDVKKFLQKDGMLGNIGFCFCLLNLLSGLRHFPGKDVEGC
jgi:hypothetical protein